MLAHMCPHGGSGSITCKGKMKERSKTTHAGTEEKNVCVHVSTQDLWEGMRGAGGGQPLPEIHNWLEFPRKSPQKCRLLPPDRHCDFR